MASSSNPNYAHRSEAGSQVMERPNPAVAANNAETRTDGGNVQLMEARLLQLYSSLRALYRSNQELTQALEENPDDQDFMEALEENWQTIRKQRELAMELVTEIKQRGLVTYDLPQDICDMKVPAWRAAPTKKELDEQGNHQTEEGLYL